MIAYIAPVLMRLDEIIAKTWYILPEQLYQKTRRREIVEGRYVAIWLKVTVLGMNIRQASRHYGIDHATGHYAMKTVKTLIETDDVFRLKFENVKSKLMAIEK